MFFNANHARRGETVDGEISKQELRGIYFNFLKDFREYLIEYVRESVTELCINEVEVTGRVKLFDGFTFGKVKIKNQGDAVCSISTSEEVGYRLFPGESTPEFFVNKQVIATTVSGTTSLGMIKT